MMCKYYIYVYIYIYYIYINTVLMYLYLLILFLIYFQIKQNLKCFLLILHLLVALAFVISFVLFILIEI